jgi:hypothetical protein
VLESDGVVIENIYFAGEPGNSQNYVRFSSYYGILPIEMIEYLNGRPIADTRLSFDYASDIPSIEQLLESDNLELSVLKTENRIQNESTISFSILDRGTGWIGDCEYEYVGVSTTIDLFDFLETTNSSYLPQLGVSVTEMFFLAFKEEEGRMQVGQYFPERISVHTD